MRVGEEDISGVKTSLDAAQELVGASGGVNANLDVLKVDGAAVGFLESNGKIGDKVAVGHGDNEHGVAAGGEIETGKINLAGKFVVFALNLEGIVGTGVGIASSGDFTRANSIGAAFTGEEDHGAVTGASAVIEVVEVDLGVGLDESKRDGGGGGGGVLGVEVTVMIKIIEFCAVDFGVPLEFDRLNVAETGAADTDWDDPSGGIGGESGAVIGDGVGEELLVVLSSTRTSPSGAEG